MNLNEEIMKTEERVRRRKCEFGYSQVMGRKSENEEILNQKNPQICIVSYVEPSVIRQPPKSPG